ncbi:UNVERIFIED_CONTAM: hypothetical protein GTU68_005990 [Idotea baltica]|nr:hypothetical protein [Idotea baltica]
MKFQMEN